MYILLHIYEETKHKICLIMIFMFLITNAILGIKFPVGMNEYSKIMKN